MNKLEEIQKTVAPLYGEIHCWPHGWLHIRNVVASAKALSQMEGVDPYLPQVAAYCHDLGRIVEEQNKTVNPIPGSSGHAELSVPLTQKILTDLGFDSQDINIVCEAVGVHQQRKYEGDNKVALILQDADRKDGLGRWGVIRLAVFNARIDEIAPPLNDAEIELAHEKILQIISTDEDKRQMMIRATKFTIAWYDELLNTKSAREYLKADWEFSKEFLQKILELK
jgi:HD superfamily phosphodiesterase